MSGLFWRLLSFDAGVVGLVVDAESVRQVVFLGSRRDVVESIGKTWPAVEQPGRHALLDETCRQVEAYFSGRRQIFDLPLADSELTAFARRIHAQLRQVPYAEVITYGELADRCAAPGAARAVGNVMAANPFPLIVPCHRVVGAGGRIGGYSGGRGGETKRWLLDFEKRHR